MKKLMYLLMALGLAPASHAAAPAGTASAHKAGFNKAAVSLIQLQNWSPAAQNQPAFLEPEAALAEESPFAPDGSAYAAAMKSSDIRGSLCCTSGAACIKVRDSGFAVLGVQAADFRAWNSSLTAFRALTAGRWYTSFPDGTALTDGSVGSIWVTRKSFVGAYRFKIEAMSVLVTWNPDPLLGFAKPGSTTMTMSKVCFAQDRIEVFASGHKLEISATPRPVLIQPSPNTGTDKPVLRDGYLMSTEYGQYLVSSDGK